MILLYPINLFAQEAKHNILKLPDLVVIEDHKPVQAFNDQPYSGNVFVLQDLEERGIDSVQDLTAEVPNLHFLDSGLSSYQSVLTMRGLGNTPIFSTPSVIFFIDDIPYSGSFSYANRIHDFESIKVYRGPQGALFGKNSYAGVISLTSRQPNNKLKTHLSAGYSRFDTWTVDGYSGGALIKDKLFFSLGGSFTENTGYMRNTFLNNKPDGEEHVSGRVSLIWKPSNAWDINLIGRGYNFNDAMPHISPIDSDDSLAIQSNENGNLEQSSNTSALKIRYKTDGLQFLSVTSRRDWQLDDFFIDTDFTSLPLGTLKGNERQTQWTQELRISSKKTGLAWSVGVFALTEKHNRKRIIKLFGQPDFIFDSTVEDESYAIFANLSYDVSDKFRVHGGIRLDYVDKKVNRNISITTNYTNNKDFFFTSPKLSVDYLFSDNFMFYFSTGLAFKPGGFSVAAINPTLSEFDSETMWANEVGFKSHWLDDRLKINMAFFHYQIDNYQVEKNVSFLDYTIINAEEATSYGIELETGIELLPGLKAEAAFSYTHIRFDEYNDPLTNTNLKGNTAPYIPEKSLTIAAQYNHPRGYFVRSEWVWNDKIYFDDANSDAFKEDDYSTLNVRLGYQGKHLSLYLFGENLTDNRYFSYILPPNSGVPSKPRVFGIKIGLDL